MIWGVAVHLSYGGWTMIVDEDLLLTIRILQTVAYYGKCVAEGTTMSAHTILKSFRKCALSRIRRDLSMREVLTQ